MEKFAYIEWPRSSSRNAYSPPLSCEFGDLDVGTTVAIYHRMSGGVNRFTNLRAWQACETYKNAVYKLCDEAPLVDDWKRRNQLEEAVRGPGAHIAEGFGRFSPPDFARFVVMARASLMESQNHLIDLVDRRYITEDRRAGLDRLAVTALEEVTGLLEYLQSPEALRNARRARERRIAARGERRTLTPNRRTPNPEHRTQTPEHRTEHTEPGTEPEHEQGTENPEG